VPLKGIKLNKSFLLPLSLLIVWILIFPRYVFSYQVLAPLKNQAQFDNIRESSQKPISIAYMPPATEFNYYLDIDKGIKARALAAGHQSFMFAPQIDNPQIQLKMLQEVIRRQVDAIILSTHDPSLLAPVVKNAVEAGILVVIVNSDMSSFVTPVHSIVGYLQREGTRKIGQFALDKIGASKPIKVGIIEGAPGYHSIERVGGFLDSIRDSTWQVVASENGKWNTEGGYKAASKIFTAHPEIKVVFAANDFEILGVESALRSLGKKGVMLLGNDGDPSALEQVANGSLSATVYTDPVGMGEVVMQVVLDSIFGSFKGGLVETPTLVVNKDNVDKYWQRPLRTADSDSNEINIVGLGLEGLIDESGLGLYGDILRAVYEPLGILVEFIDVPAKRAMIIIQNNEADAMLGSLKGEVENVLYPQWHYSADIVSVIYKKNKFQNWQGQETMKNNDVGWIRGYNYERHLYIPVNKSEVEKTYQSLLMLTKDRVQFTLDNRFNLKNVLTRNKARLLKEGFEEREYQIQELIRIKQYLAFANTEKAASFRKIFDERIPQLLHSGELKSMFEKWLFEPFPFE